MSNSSVSSMIHGNAGGAGHGSGRNALVLDTSMEACQAAIATPDGILTARASEPMSRGHAEALMPMVAALMEASAGGLEGDGFAGLGRIIVTTGPGSFTGIRVGLSAARGFALALGIPVIGVTTLEAFARTARMQAAPDHQDLPVAVALDARRDHLFGQLFDAAGAPLSPPSRDTDAVFAASLPQGPLLLAGTAAGRIAPLLDALGKIWFQPEKIWFQPDRNRVQASEAQAPALEAIAALGLARLAADTPPAPLYLRAADAKPHQGGAIPRVPS